MTMRYGTDDVEAGRRRRRAGQTPARQVEGTYRVDPRGNVTPPKELAPQQPRAAARQTVNQRNEPQYWVRGSASPREVGRIGGKVPPTRPQLSQAVDRFTDKYGGMQRDARMQRPMATPMPFAQQLVQSGMMTENQPMRDRGGQIIQGLSPGYSVNPSHPIWQSGSVPQFAPGRSPMDYYGWDAFRGQMPYRIPQMPGAIQGMQDVGSRGGQIPQQGVPRVWNESEMTPQGFRGIMDQYVANVPWMRQMQSMPYPVPQMPFGF